MFGTPAVLLARVWGVAETYAQLQAENIHLRQQAHYYQSLHAKAVAKLRAAEGIIVALKEKLAEMARRLFGRRTEKNKAVRASTGTQDPRPPDITMKSRCAVFRDFGP